MQSDTGSPASVVLVSLMLASLFGLPFLKIAPNRMLSGEPVYFLSLLQGHDQAYSLLPALLLGILIAAALAHIWSGRKGAKFAPRNAIVSSRFCLGLTALAAILLISGLAGMAGARASQVAVTVSPIARTSLGSGFWLACLLLGLTAADALQRLAARVWLTGLASLMVAMPIALMLAAGWCDDLSILKEYANRPEVFWQALLRHLQIVALALVLSLLLGLPLGWATYRYGRVGNALFPVLNIIQTIPSIALFGLLMAPLALLAAAWPALGRAGISGVGLAPGVIALILYSLLPVVRSTLAGLAQLPSAMLQAASGMGMSPLQVFWRIEVPLAMPIVLGGVRTAAIQSVGLAAVTALIGAGGLGSIMFEGLFSSAQDLVLLGVLPIIALGVLADRLFGVLVGLAQRRSGAGA